MNLILTVTSGFPLQTFLDGFIMFNKICDYFNLLSSWCSALLKLKTFTKTKNIMNFTLMLALHCSVLIIQLITKIDYLCFIHILARKTIYDPDNYFLHHNKVSLVIMKWLYVPNSNGERPTIDKLLQSNFNW